MSKICSHFDTYYDAWNGEIGALCYLLCPDRRDSLDVAFQSFLRLGGAKEAQIEESGARMLLFQNAVRLCDDYYLKKLRRAPSRKRLEAQSLPFPVTDALLSLLRLPFRRRAALILHHFGFTPAQTGEILRISSARAEKLAAAEDIPGWQDAIDSVKMTEDEAYVMSDRIVERFAERSVGVENAIHDARNTFDRAAPYLALAVLALFAAAIWYVKR